MRPLAELVRPNIRTLAPYSTARDEYGGQRIDVWLDANESPYDNGVNRYPDPRQQRLRELLAARKGIATDRIFIGSGSDEGKIAFESKARGAKKAVQTLVSTMKEHGFIGGNVAISHCDNFALAQTLKNSILDIWENTSIEILPTRGLCSYYAERGGIMLGFES